MWEAIASNKRRSILLLVLMAIILALLGASIGMTIDPVNGPWLGAGIALGFWFLELLIALLEGDNVLLMTAGARQIQKEDAPQLWNIVEEMTIASGLGTMPAVYIIENDAPNAFAVGRSPKKSAVAVTSGLLSRLNRDELQGVIAHEIGHIANYDIRYMTLAAIMVGTIVILSDVFLRSFRFGGNRRIRTSKGGVQAQLIIILVTLVIALLAPLCARILYFACSRQREYLADASSARFTRYPEGLASALEKIAYKAAPVKQVSRTLAPLYIVNPLQGFSASDLLSTHPSTESRIKILRSMAGGAGYAEYEKAFKNVMGKGNSCIGSRTLQEAGEAIPKRAPTAEPPSREKAIEQTQTVNDLLSRIGDFLLIPCACGVRIKVPPQYRYPTIACPRCGSQHAVPRARMAESASAPQGPKTLQFERSGNSWESFQCACGKTIQVSPSFIAPFIRCPKCKRKIEVSQGQKV